eukprot:gene21971-1277_t
MEVDRLFRTQKSQKSQEREESPNPQFYLSAAGQNFDMAPMMQQQLQAVAVQPLGFAQPMKQTVTTPQSEYSIQDLFVVMRFDSHDYLKVSVDTNLCAEIELWVGGLLPLLARLALRGPKQSINLHLCRGPEIPLPRYDEKNDDCESETHFSNS